MCHKCRFRGFQMLYPTSVTDVAQNVFVPKHRVVQYVSCNASYTPGSPLVYRNSAPQGPCMRARERGGLAPPPHWRHTKPAALELLHRPTAVQPRAYTCICMTLYMRGHRQAYGRRTGPRSPGSRMRHAGSPAPPPCGSGKETRLGRRPGSSSGYWFWNWVKPKHVTRRPQEYLYLLTACYLLRCGLRVGSFSRR